MKIGRNVKDTKNGVMSLVTSHNFSKMKIGRNDKDTKNGVLSLVTRHYFSKMAALCEMPIGISQRFFQDGGFMSNPLVTSHNFSKMAECREKELVTSHYFCYLDRYVVSLNVINIWRSKTVSTPSPLQPQLSPYNASTPPPPPLPRQSCQSFIHVFILVYYL